MPPYSMIPREDRFYMNEETLDKAEIKTRILQVLTNFEKMQFKPGVPFDWSVNTNQNPYSYQFNIHFVFIRDILNIILDLIVWIKFL